MGVAYRGTCESCRRTAPLYDVMTHMANGEPQGVFVCWHCREKKRTKPQGNLGDFLWWSLFAACVVALGVLAYDGMRVKEAPPAEPSLYGRVNDLERRVRQLEAQLEERGE